MLPSAAACLSALLQPFSIARAIVLASPYERLAISVSETRREFTWNSWDLAAPPASLTISFQPAWKVPAAVGVFTGEDAGLLVAEGAGAGG